MRKKIKTLKAWEKTDKDLSDFLQPTDEVDEALYNYAAEVAAPKFCFKGFIQMCDPSYKEHGVTFIATFMRQEERYFYLGELPAFSSGEDKMSFEEKMHWDDPVNW